MPCDSITTQSINLANAIGSLLGEALELTGWNITGQTDTYIHARKGADYLYWSKGSGLEIKGMKRADDVIQEVTRAYSARAVGWAAQRAGWKVLPAGKNILTVSKR